MEWFKKQHTNLSNILKTGFFTSIISYISFWVLDLLRPGFVSRYFSIHIFLLSAIIFGFLWGNTMKQYKDRSYIQIVFGFIFGLVFSVLIWIFGKEYEELRLLVSVMGLFIPLLVIRLLRYK